MKRTRLTWKMRKVIKSKKLKRSRLFLKTDFFYLERNEYVLNDTGYIWRGTTRRSSPCAWNFGQFEDKILDTALHLIMNDKRIRARKGSIERPLFKRLKTQN